MSEKLDYIVQVNKEKLGFNKEVGLYYMEINAMCSNSYTEYMAIITASGVDVDRLTIKDLRIQFVDPYLDDVIKQRYSSDLFEEIYNEVFDELYKLQQEEMLAV